MSVVAIDNRSGEELPLETYQRFAHFVLDQHELPAGFKEVELAVSYVEPDEIRALNAQYRARDEVTDVLSFECDGMGDEDFPQGDLTVSVLGDVIIAPAVARQHAEEFNTTFEDEMLLMLVHGILHLLGYDHINDKDYEEMRAREDELLQSWEASA